MSYSESKDEGFVGLALGGRVDFTVADPGFPRRGGANPPGGGTNLLFCPIFTKNCMKMKEFGPRGGARPWRPP